MSRICELTDRKKSFGNKVSHSNRKTKRTFLLNLHKVTLTSDILNKKFKFRIATRTLRTIDYKGSLDDFLLNTKTVKLSEKAQKIKRMLRKKQQQAV
ncbi:50S ribosomal protein L28 [Wolbachia endosymbiont of Pentalonia nigronervosa]|uniref:50S ribosomal protein L28 n=1 Tax=Wolbachia endosymbiont of Pentalonia nigronervosa TaxID=1301914 RepID=UPI00165FE6D4|nr:50S ribosomal protein L28 [Wolbachia endosymbiont of Pentalonia nigronervosa]